MGIESKMKLFVALAAIIGFAHGGCPNGCSGHGSCGTSDVCGCYKGFFGGDCSFRYCPVGPSWTVTPIEKLLDDRHSESIILNTPGGFLGRSKFDTNPSNHYPIAPDDFKNTFAALYPKRPNFNQYTECSSRGTCDYATGECKCFDGFEGRGCRRTSCPNGCSGHGRCLSNMHINPNQYMSFNYPNDQMYDQKRTQGCSCDRGYTGYDCNSRICPFGDDPTSDCGENSAGDVQLIVTRSPHDSVTDSERYFTLSFTDMFGGTFTTRPILDHAPSCALPDAKTKFTDSSNAGKQNTLTCELVSDSTVNGAQPKYASVSLCKVYNVGGPEWFDESGTALELDLKATFAELTTKIKRVDLLGAANSANAATTYEDFQPCSSKGDYDSATGTCTCNAGHYGEACEKQRTYY